MFDRADDRAQNDPAAISLDRGVDGVHAKSGRLGFERLLRVWLFA
jgi:hypothetical protein